MDVAQLFLAMNIPNKPAAGSVIVSASKETERVFWIVSSLLMELPDSNRP
jgi:hypothetical protein